jgi:DNA polymerase-3 subunit gamma/tau
MSQALYRKWRPQQWNAVAGQPHVVNTLRNALAADRIAHAYLFAGPRGTGKTTVARLLAKAVNCLEENPALRPCGECNHCQSISQGRFLDLIEIDAASNTSVEDVRDLRDKIGFSPNQGRYKVYIIDEVHMLSTAAFNALLKTLEEPPPHAIFVLATTEVHKIPSTVLSRCQRHEFRRIPVMDIIKYLVTVANSEKIEVEEATLSLIARQSTGSMRDAISLLDQLASTGNPISLEMAQDVLGTATSQAVLTIVDALIARQPDKGLNEIHAALDKGSDPRQFARQIVEYLRDILFIRLESSPRVDTYANIYAQNEPNRAGHNRDDRTQSMDHHARAFNPADLLQLIRIFNHAAVEARGMWQPSLPLEMAFVESVELLSNVETNPLDTQSRPTSSLRQPGISSTRSSSTVTESTNSSKEIPEPSSIEQEAAQTLTESWNKILALVRQKNPRAYGLLNSCKSRYLRGNNLVLYFSSEVLKGQMEKPDNLDIACQALRQVLQREITIQCNVDTTRRGVGGSKNVIPSGVEENGMVAAALRDLGGEIVDIT